MKILKTVQKIPGGLMMIPLLLAVVINTFAPKILRLGSFSTAVFSNEGIYTIVGLSLFFMGSSFKIKEGIEVIKRGSVLLIVKILSGAFIGLIINKFAGYGGILGMSTLAIIAATTNSNNALYMTLVNEYGEEKDVAAQSILNFNIGPFVTLLIFGSTGLASIPLKGLISTIAPLIVGAILGNLDEDIREFLKPGIAITIPFSGFCLGASMNLRDIVHAGYGGILLGILVIVGTGVPLVLLDRIINKRPGYAGAALASTAGSAVIIPSAAALIDPKFGPYVTAATTQIAAAAIITIVATPMVTHWVSIKLGCEKFKNRAYELGLEQKVAS